jgi:hypothetical protein
VASEFLERYGQPESYRGRNKSDEWVKEQIYNWFKNRSRRKVTGRSTGKPASTEKTADNAEPDNEFHDATWSQGSMGSNNGHPSIIQVPSETAFTTVSSSSQGSCSSASIGPWKAVAGPEASALLWQIPTPTQGKHQLQLTSATLQDVLLSPVAVDPVAITALIQSSTMSSNVSLMKPLNPLITALFDAALLIDISFDRWKKCAGM